MPKQVDHEERRITIAEALLRVAANRGLDSVSLRHVAAEAGVSPGMVQHYFRTKDEMMAFALKVIADGVEQRMERSLSELGGSPSATDLCRCLLVELLPLDDRRRAEGRAALAFLAYRSVHPSTPAARDERDGIDRIRGHVADLIEAEQPDRDATAIGPTVAATALLALVDGLGVQVLGGQYSPETALEVYDVCAAALVAR